MTKIFNTLAAAAIVTAIALLFTACDNKTIKPAEPETPVLKEVTLATTVYVNKGMLDTYDIDATSSTGQKLTFASTPVKVKLQSSGEEYNLYPMTTQVSGNNIPLNDKINLNFTLKKGYEVPNSSDFIISVLAKGSMIYDKTQNNTEAKKEFDKKSLKVLGNKITEYTTSLNKQFAQITTAFDKDGVSITTGQE